MVIRVDDLIKSVKRQVGTDAYAVYPDSLREIPDAVLWGFASACILEFVKAFVDFKGIGEKARKQVDELLKEIRLRRGFEQFCRSEGLDASVAEALLLIPQPITTAQAQAGVTNLESALKEVGVNADDARSLAEKIGKNVSNAAKAGG